MIITWNRGNSPNHVARSFHLEEFECPCGGCSLQKVDSSLLEQLDALRDIIKAPIIIVSGFRCARYNKTLGGPPKSPHLSGFAASIYSPKYSLEELEKLSEKYFSRIIVTKKFLTVVIDRDGK